VVTALALLGSLLVIAWSLTLATAINDWIEGDAS
jgi:hypothetical protein